MKKTQGWVDAGEMNDLMMTKSNFMKNCYDSLSQGGESEFIEVPYT